MTNYISRLTSRYFKGKHNRDIENKVQQWLIDDKHVKEKEDALYQIWEQIQYKNDKAVYHSLNEVNAKIGQSNSKRWPMRYSLPRVAAILIPLLTLVGVWVYQINQIEIISVTTNIGEQKEVMLPDGSTVWLNACSKIEYPEKFSDSIRNITLTGEAYFSVKHNKDKHFEVSSEAITVKVLGTEFNIKAYIDDENITTTLTSGKIAVSLPQTEYTLNPNEELVYNRTSKKAILENVSSDSVNWRDGSLIFNDRTMAEIFKELERQFDVKFDCSHSRLSNDRYSIKFTNSEELQQILNLFQDLSNNSFTYKINEKTIIITTE